MKKRKRFNAACLICSSENYSASRKAHLLALRTLHEKYGEMLKEKYKDVTVKPHYTEVKIFGKWYPIKGPIDEKYEGFELR